MADVTVDAATHTSGESIDMLWGPYWTSPSVGYIISVDPFAEVEVRKTEDSGASWAVQDSVNAPADSSVSRVAAWKDTETPGDSGTLLHIAWGDTFLDAVGYIIFDTSDDTYGTRREVDLFTAFGNIRSDIDISITKSKSGRVYICARSDFELDTENTDHSMRSSSDNFATNNESETSPYTSDEEQLKLYPGADADEDDICAVVFDGVNKDFEFWKFDASAGTWGVTTILNVLLTRLEVANFKTLFDAVIRHSDEHILFAAWNDLDQASADLRTWDITQATPTITQKGIIESNSDDMALVAMMINQQNDDVYVAYVGSDDGSQTWLSAVQCHYVLSTDDLGTWSNETTYGVQNDDLRMISAGRSVGDAGGRFMPSWFNDDLNTITVNDGNDIEIAAVSVGGVGALMAMMQMNQFDGGQTSFV